MFDRYSAIAGTSSSQLLTWFLGNKNGGGAREFHFSFAYFFLYIRKTKLSPTFKILGLTLMSRVTLLLF